MKRRWRYRLVQVSPLIVIALAVAVWVSLPIEVASSGLGKLLMFSAPAEFRLNDQEILVSVMEAVERSRSGFDRSATEVTGGGPRAIESLARRTSTELAKLEPAVCDERGYPRDLSDDELAPMIAQIEKFEDKQGATISVLVLPAAERVPVVLSALADPSVLTAEELEEFQTDGTIDAIRRAAARLSGGTVLPNVEAVNGGAGEVIEGRFMGGGTMALDGHLWATYTIAPGESAASDMVTGDLWQSIDDENLAWAVENAARATRGCVFVVGPIEDEPVLVRSALQPDDGATLAAWNVATTAQGRQAFWQPTGLRSEDSRVVGGAHVVEVALAGSGQAPRVALVALYDQHPRVRVLWDRIGRDPYAVYMVWVGSRLSEILGGLGVLLIASLVASPLAFRADRLARERFEVERERQRVQHETERRVVDRLNELSTRMDAVIARASESTAADVSGVSEDIESTISELRAILGSVIREPDDE